MVTGLNEPNPAAEAFVMAFAAVATVMGVTIPLLQMDTVSRRILSADKLEAKRQWEYSYRWTKTLELAIVYARGGPDYDNTLALLTKTITSTEDIAALVQRILTTPATTQILAIDLDDNDPRATREYYLYLQIDDRQYQVPLVAFGTHLADVMDDQMTTTALCFVADASSGLGTHVIATVLEQCQAGVAVIREPLWMALFAQVVEKRVISSAHLERVLFGLCRMEAWRVRDQVGTARTVMVTLPGQACSPALIPLLQKAFPCERHLFVYDGCVASVKRALRWRQKGPLPTTGFSNAVIATTPMARSITMSIRNLSVALANLPVTLADTTEVWMASVDAFLKLKDDEKTNEYLPYVLKLSLLMNGSSLDEEGSNRRLALINLLQFVTGSRSRPIPPNVVDAAVESLRDVSATTDPLTTMPLPTVTEGQRKAIEDCVFRHKGILIGDKTLIDTVLPAKEWTLKAAKKVSGCSCCAPDEEDDDDDDDNNKNMVNGVDMTLPGAFAKAFDFGNRVT